jgi:LysM domain.
MEKQAVPISEKVFFDRIDKELEFDAVLPEYCPNIAKVVKLDAYPKLESKNIDQNNIYVEGVIIFKLIYISDFKNKLKCVNFSSDYSHSFNSPGIADKVGEDGFLTIQPYINTVNVKMINPRKLIFKTKMTIAAEATNCLEATPYLPPADDKMELLYKDITCCKTTHLPDTILKITEDIAIESEMPPISEIIFADANVYVEDLKTQDNSTSLKAYAVIKCLYESEGSENEGSEYVSMQKKIPITGEIECEGLESPFVVSLQSTLSSLTAEPSVDTYGENRIITCNLAIDLSANAYKNDTYKICEDGFSPEYQSNVIMKPFSCDQLLKSVAEMQSVTEKLKVDLKNVSDVIEAFADAKVQNTEIMDDKIIMNGKAKISIIGSNAEGDMESFDTSFMFHLPLQNAIPDNTGDIRFVCGCEVADVDCHIENGELVVTIMLAVRCAMFNKVTHKAIYDIEEDEENPRVKCPSEMTIYYPSKEDTLWTVAKKYGVSPEKIKGANKNCKENFEGRRIVVIPCHK